MDVVFQIILAIMLLFAAGVVGYAIATIQALKDLGEISALVDRLSEGHDKLTEAADKAIESCRGVVEKTYINLVNLRNNGTEDLDELIGHLGEFLDDAKED